jgi:hypothetical protein
MITAAYLDRVLERVKIRDQLSVEIRTAIYKARPVSLRSVLRRMGDYGFFTGSILWVYFHMKAAGINLSIFGCKLLLSAAVIALVGAPATYVVVEMVETVTVRPGVEPVPEASEWKESPSNSAREPVSRIVPGMPRIRLGEISVFSDRKIIGERIGRALAKGIRICRGDLAIAGDEQSARSILIGELVPLGRKKVLTVRIVEAGDGAVKFSDAVSFEREGELDAGIQELARKICDSEELWK